MKSLYTIANVVQDEFRLADLKYESIKGSLSSAEWCDLSHADVERRLFTDGAELMRLLLQSHYTLRGQARPVEDVVGNDGLPRNHVREGTARAVETVFGTVRAVRAAYSGRHLEALHPTDADLNLPRGRYSLEVERQVALGAARNSFDATAGLLRRTTAATVGKRQVEELARSAATDFPAFYEDREFDKHAQAETGPILVLSVDQKGVILRTEDLNDATRKIAEGRRRKLQTRYCKGEPHGRKRLATVATVYTIQPHFRTAVDVINGLRRIRSTRPSPKPRPELKRLWASLQESPQEVIAEAFEEALKRDPERRKQWYVLIDGDDDLERWVREAARDFDVDIIIGLDVIHALQYLWKAGMAFHKEGTTELEEWVLERLEKLLDGKVSDVAAGIRRSATLRELSPEDRVPVDKCADYFLKRTALMRYDELLAAGAPIATGVVEGGCKYLINDRLDITGARWSLAGAEAVLRLRAVIVSGDFDEYWNFHEIQERTRNHDQYYENDRSTRVRLPKPTKRNAAGLRA